MTIYERKWVKLKDVQLWDDNPNEGDVGAIITSIRKFGYRDTISLWKDNITKDGNHRVKALAWLRAERWQPDEKSTCLSVNDDDWFITYEDIGDMNQIESDAFGLVKNRTVRLGHDDPLTLKGLLLKINDTDDEDLLVATGYDKDYLDLINTIGGERADMSDDTTDEEPYEDFMPQICHKLPTNLYTKYRNIITKYAGDTENDKFCAFLMNLDES